MRHARATEDDFNQNRSLSTANSPPVTGEILPETDLHWHEGSIPLALYSYRSWYK